MIRTSREDLVGQLRRCAESGASLTLDTAACQLVLEQPPIPLQLWCPLCGTRHIDEGEWATRVHHTHSCQNPKCGLTWRPAVVPTVGVYTLPGFLNAEPTK